MSRPYSAMRRAHDGDGAPDRARRTPRLERALVGGGVDACGKPRDDDGPACGKLAGDATRIGAG